MKQFVVVAKDKIGLLADISKALATAKVNIDSISAEAVGSKAVIRIVCSNEKNAEEALSKKGFKVVSSDVLVVKLENKPGELSELTRKLSRAKINIQNVHLLSKGPDEGIFALKVDKTEKARKVLKDYF